MSSESYYDNDDDGNVFEPSTSYNSKNKKSKLKKNVNGPYNVILTIQGIKYDITMVENYLNVFCFVKKEFSFMHKESLSIHNILI